MRTVVHALAIIASVLAAQIALGQAPPFPAVPLTPAENLKASVKQHPAEQPANSKPQRFDADAGPEWVKADEERQANSKLQRFDVNFLGGGPRELVAAIEKATGRPLNAIVPSQNENVEIPPMKLTNVTVPDLFEALKRASLKQESLPGRSFQSSYGFETRGQGEDAVWYFVSQKPTRPPDICRFYQLAEYLDNFTIEDITTAIQTGWELLGVKPTSRLKFHPETKLLIAVGQNYELGTIEDVLAQLRKAPPKKAATAAAEKPAPAPTPKKDGASNN
jgi:hypothetical protein